MHLVRLWCLYVCHVTWQCCAWVCECLSGHMFVPICHSCSHVSYVLPHVCFQSILCFKPVTHFHELDFVVILFIEVLKTKATLLESGIWNKASCGSMYYKHLFSFVRDKYLVQTRAGEDAVGCSFGVCLHAIIVVHENLIRHSLLQTIGFHCVLLECFSVDRYGYIIQIHGRVGASLD